MARKKNTKKRRSGLLGALVLLILLAAFTAMGFVPYCFEFAVSCAVLVAILALIGLAGALRQTTDPLPVIKNVTRNFHPF